MWIYSLYSTHFFFFVGGFCQTALWHSSQSFYVTSRIHRCPQNKTSDARAQDSLKKKQQFTLILKTFLQLPMVVIQFVNVAQLGLLVSLS